MPKMDALRRFLLPCFHPTTPTPPPPPPTTTKKRLSTSLRDDLDDNNKTTQDGKEDDQDSTTTIDEYTNNLTMVPPRPSRTMVIGTIFGHRRGTHVWFCVQHNRLSSKPSLLLELSIPTSLLVQEMSCGLVRLALEFHVDSPESELSHFPLHSVPLWTMCCNGRKLGFAVKRKATGQIRQMLKTMQNMTVGAGVIPSGFGSGSDINNGGAGGGELMYMRANYECVVGSADSESFHLINPDEGPGQEFSVFLLRSR